MHEERRTFFFCLPPPDLAGLADPLSALASFLGACYTSQNGAHNRRDFMRRRQSQHDLSTSTLNSHLNIAVRRQIPAETNKQNCTGQSIATTPGIRTRWVNGPKRTHHDLLPWLHQVVLIAHLGTKLSCGGRGLRMLEKGFGYWGTLTSQISQQQPWCSIKSYVIS